MGLNKHMMLEEHELEQEIARLEGEPEDGVDGCWMEGEWWDYEEDCPPPTAADLARAEELRRRLAELRDVQRKYNQFLGGVSDGKPAPDGSPRFYDHVEAFERIQNANEGLPAKTREMTPEEKAEHPDWFSFVCLKCGKPRFDRIECGWCRDPGATL
jgi:hypothetical protein